MKKVIFAVVMSLSCSVFAAEVTKSEMNTEKLTISNVSLPTPAAQNVEVANTLILTFSDGNIEITDMSPAPNTYVLIQASARAGGMIRDTLAEQTVALSSAKVVIPLHEFAKSIEAGERFAVCVAKKTAAGTSSKKCAKAIQIKGTF